jgi:hypothetical protein
MKRANTNADARFLQNYHRIKMNSSKPRTEWATFGPLRQLVSADVTTNSAVPIPISVFSDRRNLAPGFDYKGARQTYLCEPRLPTLPTA